MEFVETTILRESWDIDRRLSELNLTREGLLDVRAVAMNEGANATPRTRPGLFCTMLVRGHSGINLWGEIGFSTERTALKRSEMKNEKSK